MRTPGTQDDAQGKFLGKFVSGRMMVKEARYVDDAFKTDRFLSTSHSPLLSKQPAARRRYQAR